MVNGIKVHPEILRSSDSSMWAGNYVVCGSPTVNAGVLVCFINDTSVDVTVSWDGTNAHMFLAAGSFRLLDISTNERTGNYLYIPLGTQFYVRGNTGTGSFYIEYYYSS